MKRTINFQKNYIIRWILLFVAIIATSVLPMSQKIAYKAQQFIQRSLQPFNAKQALVNAATAASFGLASYSFFRDGYKATKFIASDEFEKTIKSLPDLPLYADNHIKDVLGEYAPKIRKINPDIAYFAIYNDKALFVGEEELEEHKWPKPGKAWKKTVPANWILWHEAKHYHNKDYLKRVLSLISIPIMVQGTCSFITKNTKRLFAISTPKTWPQALLRSSFALMSFIPKLLYNNVAYITHKRHREKAADKFACEHVSSQYELELAHDWLVEKAIDLKKAQLISKPSSFNDISTKNWLYVRDSISCKIKALNEKERHVPANDFNERMLLQNRKRLLLKALEFWCDPDHPHVNDRLRMIKHHIYNWDKNHPKQ